MITSCLFCYRAQESIFHVPVSCPFIVSFWHWSGINEIHLQALDFMGWFKEILERGNVNLVYETSTIAWSIRKAHNDLL